MNHHFHWFIPPEYLKLLLLFTFFLSCMYYPGNIFGGTSHDKILIHFFHFFWKKSFLDLLEPFWHFFMGPESKNVHKTTKLGSYRHWGNLNQNVKKWSPNLFGIKFCFQGVIIWSSTTNARPRSRRVFRCLFSKECLLLQLKLREIWKNVEHKLVRHWILV